MATCGATFAAALPPKGLADVDGQRARQLVAGLPVPGRTGSGAVVMERCGAFVTSDKQGISHVEPNLAVVLLGRVTNLPFLAEHANVSMELAPADIIAALYKSTPLRTWLPLVRGRYTALIMDSETGKAAIARGPNGSPAVIYSRDADGNAVILAGDGVSELSEPEALGRVLQPLRFLYGNGHLDVVRAFRLDNSVELAAQESAHVAANAALKGLGAAVTSPPQATDTGTLRSWRRSSSSSPELPSSCSSSFSSASSSSSWTSSSRSNSWRSGPDATPVAFTRYSERRTHTADDKPRWRSSTVLKSNALEIMVPVRVAEVAEVEEHVAAPATSAAAAVELAAAVVPEVLESSALFAPTSTPEVFEPSALLAPTSTPEVFESSALLAPTFTPEVFESSLLLASVDEEEPRRSVSPRTERNIEVTVGNLYDSFVVPARGALDGGSRTMQPVTGSVMRHSLEAARKSLEESRRSLDTTLKRSNKRYSFGDLLSRFSLDGRRRSSNDLVRCRQ